MSTETEESYRGLTHDQTSGLLKDRTRHAVQRIFNILVEDYKGPVSLYLDGARASAGASRPVCTVVFKHPGALRSLILRHDLVRVAEAHLAGEVDIVGTVEGLFDLVDHLLERPVSWLSRLKLLSEALRLPSSRAVLTSRQSRAGGDARCNSRHSISHHYDVSNEFYRLWLDPEMVYSCAYFRDENQSLAAAQQDKLDYICRKLRLAPGLSLLDVGCGWGALIAWAARHYGIRAHGITLSEQQYRHALERIAREKLHGQVTVELRDYRELPATAAYDRIVSVGMFEHIGTANFPRYFGLIKRALKPGGLFLNHGITNDTGWRPQEPVARFINRYVFPDGELARVSEVTTAMENAGFEILDVEGLRQHYALTLRHWVRALETQAARACSLVGEATYRLWRLYMSGSAFYFNQGSLGIYQILAGHNRKPLTLPMTRDYLYQAPFPSSRVRA
jgi:cyclopropane-fatty-acyl-phospholipid synthase